MFTACGKKADTESLQDILDEQVSWDGPAVVLYIESEGCSESAITGYANIEERIPVSGDDLFRIGSASKTYVAVTALRLAERGVIDLDARISAYLAPEIIANLPYGDQINVRQLLNMTACTYDYLSDDTFWEEVDAAPTTLWTADGVLPYAYLGSANFPPRRRLGILKYKLYPFPDGPGECNRAEFRSNITRGIVQPFGTDRNLP